MSADEAQSHAEDLDLALLHQLAARVAAAGERIGAEGLQSLVCADEDMILRRLVRLRAPGLRPPAIVRIWRELVAEARAARSPVALSVSPGREAARAIDYARLSFGAAPLALHPLPDAALAAARTGAVAVLPLDADKPWWGRLLAEPALKAFAALPCLAQLGDTTALAVAQVEPEPTGADQTFWVTDALGPAAGVLAGLARDGVAGELLAEAGGLKLLALLGFYQTHDARLARAPGRLSGVIGAAPTPLDV